MSPTTVFKRSNDMPSLCIHQEVWIDQSTEQSLKHQTHVLCWSMADVVVDNGAFDSDQLNSYMMTRFTCKRDIILGVRDLQKSCLVCNVWGLLTKIKYIDNTQGCQNRSRHLAEELHIHMWKAHRITSLYYRPLSCLTPLQRSIFTDHQCQRLSRRTLIILRS